ncbi:MAG TPA: hypothetical protein VIQ78_03270 [Terrimesophilobacter sp.]|jgi:hypothetical protein|uniref:hypothetical protein n=1 Tax=Terrimesophilobacter sp. TaxID=2906435 RepID=UPI002F9503AA
MEPCEGCGREVEGSWKYCVYCGRPMHAARNIPSAIRPDSDGEPPARRYDAPFWVGVGMGALGLALIIYAAIQIYTTYA